MTASYPRIPYGEASFRRIRVNGWLYVDKTRFLRPLEDERYVFFIRPRRFGKSCWLSLLECYYGRHWAHEFEDLFGGTDLGRAPTASHAASSQPWNTTASPMCRTEGARRRNPSSAR